jgi:hypothetical protein
MKTFFCQGKLGVRDVKVLPWKNLQYANRLGSGAASGRNFRKIPSLDRRGHAAVPWGV